jgi:hypothetical protein
VHEEVGGGVQSGHVSGHFSPQTSKISDNILPINSRLDFVYLLYMCRFHSFMKLS